MANKLISEETSYSTKVPDASMVSLRYMVWLLFLECFVDDLLGDRKPEKTAD